MNSNNDLRDTLIDIARTGAPRVARNYGRIIAGFASSKDARLFASMKRDAGDQVTVVAGSPDSPFLFVVRAVVRSL